MTRTIESPIEGAEIQRNALARDVASRLTSLTDLRLVDRIVTRLEQLRALSWTRRMATSPRDIERAFHLASLAGGSVVTRCNGRWAEGDAVETSVDGPPLHLMCITCAHRWARGRDLDLYSLLEFARDLATEDLARAELHEAARLEMTGGGS